MRATLAHEGRQNDEKALHAHGEYLDCSTKTLRRRENLSFRGFGQQPQAGGFCEKSIPPWPAGGGCPGVYDYWPGPCQRRRQENAFIHACTRTGVCATPPKTARGVFFSLFSNYGLRWRCRLPPFALYVAHNAVRYYALHPTTRQRRPYVYSTLPPLRDEHAPSTLFRTFYVVMAGGPLAFNCGARESGAGALDQKQFN